jgi:iron complex transport system ATP-binding protein
MALAGVLDLGDHLVDTLAGGERQRALLARALAQEPRVLLLDEPTSHLDLLHQRHLVGLLRQLNRERGMTVIFVSHDLNLAGELADRLLLLSGGRVVRLGPPREVLDEAVLERAYGCPVWVERLASGRPVVLGVRL